MFNKLIPNLLAELTLFETRRQERGLGALQSYAAAIHHCNRLLTFEEKDKAFDELTTNPKNSILRQFNLDWRPPPMPVWEVTGDGSTGNYA